MRKILFLFILGMAVLPRCFSQNMLILGGEYNPFKPGFWNSGIGVNFELFNVHIQDDLMLNFGGITAEGEQGEEPHKFMVSIRDKFYFSFDWKNAGIRAGAAIAFGVYASSLFPESTNLFFDGGGFVGATFFPRSLISVTVDICPGYALAFLVNKDPGSAINEKGFMMPISLGIRLNLDKL